MAVLKVNKDSDQGKKIRLNGQRNCHIWKKIYIYTYIFIYKVLSPQRKSEKQLGKNASMAVFFKCLYVTLWKYKITS